MDEVMERHLAAKQALAERHREQQAAAPNPYGSVVMEDPRTGSKREVPLEHRLLRDPAMPPSSGA